MRGYKDVAAPNITSKTSIYNHNDIGWEGLGSKKWNDERAPAFAFSYPHIAKEHGLKISTLPTTTYGDFTETWKMINAPVCQEARVYRIQLTPDNLRGSVVSSV